MAVKNYLIASLALLSAVCLVLCGVPLGTSTTISFKDGLTITVTTYHTTVEPCDSKSSHPCAAVDWEKLYAALQAKSEPANRANVVGGR